MGLADSGRTADEQRVVGLRRHLGDRQRGGVRQTVAVADHELVEGELGVAERPGPELGPAFVDRACAPFVAVMPAARIEIDAVAYP